MLLEIKKHVQESIDSQEKEYMFPKEQICFRKKSEFSGSAGYVNNSNPKGETANTRPGIAFIFLLLRKHILLELSQDLLSMLLGANKL